MWTVGRDRELETIASLLDTRSSASILLLEGEAGIGKTTLWRAGVEEARTRGWRVLACEAAAAEAQLAFTVLRDLLANNFDEVADRLPPPQRRALAVTLLREEASGPPPDPGAIAVAFLGAVDLLASRSPTLLAVDDAQWIDEASTGPLAYALRRLTSGQLAVLLARRPEAGRASPLGVDGLEVDRVRVLRLGGVSVGALGRIVHDRLGTALPRPTLHKLHETSDGNPFYAVELARALADSSTPLRPGDALPVPGTLQELIRERLVSLPPDTLETLAVASALSRPTLPLLAAALEDDPLPPLRAAVDAQLAEVRDGDVRFVHPLFAAAVVALFPDRQRELHARLAEVVSDSEERARHLALATDEPDELVAQTIGDGATLAFARGSPATAAALAAEARRLTPPTNHERVLQRAITEVDYHFAAGDTLRAAALLEELLAQTPPGKTMARLLSRLARVRHFGDDIGRSVELLHDALAKAGDDDALRGEIEEGLAWGLLLIRRDLGAAATHAASAARLAQRRGDEPALAEALAAQAITEFVLGRDNWAKTMERAVSREEAVMGLRVLRHPSFAHGYCLSCADELDEARDVFLELERRAIQAGDEGSMPSLLNHLTLIEALAGRWDQASAYAEEGYARALESGQQPTRVSILAKKGLLAARRGQVDEARTTAVEALSRAGGAEFRPDEPQRAMARGGETAIWTLGFLELSLGRPDEAHRLLGGMVQALLDAGVQEPGEIRCLADDIEALVELERFDEASSLLARYDEWAERLGRASALAGAGRCRGLFSAARGDLDGAIAALDDAVRLYEGVPLPFERGRTLLALGTQQRRARSRKAARETLRSALAIFEELGAETWGAKTRAELGRIGGRAPSPGGLTPTEQRVADLVTEGKSNKEVAAALVVSVHTVEAALTSIYRKLDVRSRTELARRLAETG